jgi:dsDNA-specific endonuclease/ATPase MutS2
LKERRGGHVLVETAHAHGLVKVDAGSDEAAVDLGTVALLVPKSGEERVEIRGVRGRNQGVRGSKSGEERVEIRGVRRSKSGGERVEIRV